jgi:hypothetical protein
MLGGVVLGMGAGGIKGVGFVSMGLLLVFTDSPSKAEIP